MEKNYRIIASSKSFIEGDAVSQVEDAAAREGVLSVVGLPDLHPGKGGPVGAAMVTGGVIYPYFIGGDIGCGMRFSMLERPAKKLNPEKWARQLLKADDFFYEPGFAEPLKNSQLAKWPEFLSSLGTIGSGNHFAEFSTVESIHDEALFKRYALKKEGIYLLVHSGSRGLGNKILREYVDANTNQGCRPGDRLFKNYVKQHDDALLWAQTNRGVIALKLLNRLGCRETFLWDNFHNYLEEIKDVSGHSVYVHRKGAVKAGDDPVVIPGSRGDLSYLVKPLCSLPDHGYSLAHGAGRKWNRIKSRQKARQRYKDCDIRRIKGHALQVSWDKDALYEEIPDAYKKIETVIADLKNEGLIRVIATFRPQITFKAEL